MKKYVFWIVIVYTMLSVSPLEMMYAAFGSEAHMSDVMVAGLLCMHMCLFSAFQLFSGTLIDHYGGRVFLPLSAWLVFIGMLLQVYTRGSGFLLLMLFSQAFLTCGASFGFIGVEYLSRCVFPGNRAGIAFSLAQAIYGFLCSIFWVISAYYEPIMRYNFYPIVWSITALQLVATLIASFTSNIAEVRRPSRISGFSVCASVIRHIYCVIMKPEVWRIALMGGVMFGMFFSISSMLLYKCDPVIGGLASTYVWIGFALGSPISCWTFLHFQEDKRVFFAMRILQCCSVCLLLFFMQKIVANSHGHEMLQALIIVLLSILFGLFSGGHMIAFIMGTQVVEDSQKSVYCAIVNGFMCVIAGAIMLVITIFAEFYKLQTLLLSTSCIFLILHCWLEHNFRFVGGVRD